MRADLLSVVDTMAVALDRLTTHLQNQAVGAVQSVSVDGWYDPAVITDVATGLASQVQAGQRQTAAVVDAYLARATSQVAGRSVRPTGVVPVDDLRGGVPLDRVYGRLADEYRYQRSLGKTDGEARQLVEQRAVKMTATDAQLAARAQAQRFMVVRHVDGFRRVIHPELSKHGSCGLCAAAADQVYHRSELLPIHADCKCTVLPVVNGKDPGHQLNRADLDRLYAASGGTAGDKLKRVRVAVHEHGELGPVLTKHGDQFRGPADIAAA